MKGERSIMLEQKFVKSNYKTVIPYKPPGHSGTVNRRLIGPSLGSKNLEVVIGEMEPSGGAEPHVHNDFEQAMYILEGRLRIYTNESDDIFLPNDFVFFPIGVSHAIECLEKSKFLVLYGPPKEIVQPIISNY